MREPSERVVRLRISIGVELLNVPPMFWKSAYPCTPPPWELLLNPSAVTRLGERVESAKSNSPIRKPTEEFDVAIPLNVRLNVAVSASPMPSCTGLVLLVV